MPNKKRKNKSSPIDPDIAVSEQNGVRFLHFGTEWIQGAMRVRKPAQLELDYSRHMMSWLLFSEPPQQQLQLGLGAGSLTRFAHKYFEQSEITVVDNSHAVVAVARSQFKLPPDDDRLEVVVQDGEAHVSEKSLRGYYGLIQVDVFDGEARGPCLDSLNFYQQCRRALNDSGMMVVNLFGEVPTYALNLERIRSSFDNRVLVLPPIEQGNVIVLAFASEPTDLNWATLYERAKEVERLYGLDALGWVKGLKNSAAKRMGGGIDIQA